MLRIRFLLKELLGEIEREKKRPAENGENSNVRHPRSSLLFVVASNALMAQRIKNIKVARFD